MSNPIKISDDPAFPANVPLNNVVNTLTSPAHIIQFTSPVFSCAFPPIYSPISLNDSLSPLNNSRQTN